MSQQKTSLQGDHFILPVSQPNLCVVLQALQVDFNKKVPLTSKQTLAVLNLAFLLRGWFSFQSHRPSDQLVISASGLGRWLLQVRGCFQVTMLTKTSNFDSNCCNQYVSKTYDRDFKRKSSLFTDSCLCTFNSFTTTPQQISKCLQTNWHLG